MGYSEVPPPFNENYAFFKENEMTTTPFVNVSDESKVDRSKESSSGDQKIDEHTMSVDELLQNILKRKVHFVSVGNLGEENDKLLKGKSKILQTPSLTETNSTDKSTVKRPHKKSHVKRSCFNCHEKGHVASCCPNKKQGCVNRPVTKDKSPSKTVVQPGSSSSSHVKPVIKS